MGPLIKMEEILKFKTQRCVFFVQCSNIWLGIKSLGNVTGATKWKQKI